MTSKQSPALSVRDVIPASLDLILEAEIQVIKLELCYGIWLNWVLVTVQRCAVCMEMYRDSVIALLFNTIFQVASNCCLYKFDPKHKPIKNLTPGSKATSPTVKHSKANSQMESPFKSLNSLFPLLVKAYFKFRSFWIVTCNYVIGVPFLKNFLFSSSNTCNKHPWDFGGSYIKIKPLYHYLCSN